jgi:hypothetical protein
MKHRTLNLAIQQVVLKQRFPDSSSHIKNGQLIWKGLLTPIILSKTYTVQVCYNLSKSPAVTVLDPALEARNGKKPPHLYPGDHLCLYLPQANEWNRNMLLAETIIPWTSEWLLHYEIWLATGEWCGGGVHPERKLKLGK